MNDSVLDHNKILSTKIDIHVLCSRINFILNYLKIIIVNIILMYIMLNLHMYKGYKEEAIIMTDL